MTEQPQVVRSDGDALSSFFGGESNFSSIVKSTNHESSTGLDFTDMGNNRSNGLDFNDFTKVNKPDSPPKASKTIPKKEKSLFDGFNDPNKTSIKSGYSGLQLKPQGKPKTEDPFDFGFDGAIQSQSKVTTQDQTKPKKKDFLIDDEDAFGFSSKPQGNNQKKNIKELESMLSNPDLYNTKQTSTSSNPFGGEMSWGASGGTNDLDNLDFLKNDKPKQNSTQNFDFDFTGIGMGGVNTNQNSQVNNKKKPKNNLDSLLEF